MTSVETKEEFLKFQMRKKDERISELEAQCAEMVELLAGFLSNTDGFDEVQLRRRWGDREVARILSARALLSKMKGEEQ